MLVKAQVLYCEETSSNLSIYKNTVVFVNFWSQLVRYKTEPGTTTEPGLLFGTALPNRKFSFGICGSAVCWFSADSVVVVTNGQPYIKVTITS